MKLSYIFIVLILIFTGCTQKRVIEVKYEDKPVIKKQLPSKKVVPKETEDISVFDEVDIQEDLKFKDKPRKFRLAIVYPSKLVSKYFNSTLNTSLGYLNYRNADYNIKTFDCVDEDVESLNKCLEDAYISGYDKVIALFTPFVGDKLMQLNTYNLEIYLPLVEKHDDVRFIYGSINYEEQLNKMMEYAYMNTSIIYQDNFLGNKLLGIHQNINSDIDYTLKLDNNNNNYKNLIENREVLNYSTVFMYTNVIKTSLLLSQMTVYERYPSLILSAQQNFKPELFALTQKNDRKNLLIFSAISDFNAVLNDELDFFGADATYNWVDYSVLVGVNHLYDRNLSKLLKNEIINNQVVYETRVYEAKKYGFVEIK